MYSIGNTSEFSTSFGTPNTLGGSEAWLFFTAPVARGAHTLQGSTQPPAYPLPILLAHKLNAFEGKPLLVFRKRWPKRREFLSYYALYKVFKDKVFNLGEAVDLLTPLLGSKRVATRLVKRLVKQGFLERVAPLSYRAKPLEQLLEQATLEYFASRLRRRGLNAYIQDNHIIVLCPASEKLPEKHPLIEIRECKEENNQNQ